jgi:NADP-dependent 3-hydroxy acid dehydrogenase YdfG
MGVDQRLAGRHAFVTGATTGIGYATARILSREGATVGLAARREPELRQIASELGQSIAVPTDVTDPDAVRRAIDETEAAWGQST